MAIPHFEKISASLFWSAPPLSASSPPLLASFLPLLESSLPISVSYPPLSNADVNSTISMGSFLVFTFQSIILLWLIALIKFKRHSNS